MLGQTSLLVDKSVSKVNDQLSKQLDPQEIGSLVFNTKRGGMYYRTIDDMNEGFGNLTASCQEYTLLRAHQDFCGQALENTYRDRTSS